MSEASGSNPLGQLFEEHRRSEVGRRQSHARQEIENAVTRIVRQDAEQVGAAALERFEKREMYPGAGEVGMSTKPSPRFQLEAARALVSAARAEVADALSNARGRGVSWAEIGEWLGFQDAPGKYDMSVAFAAWRFAAAGVGPGEEMPPLRRYQEDFEARWRCYSCTGTVREGHPDYGLESERGHGADCERYAAAITAEQLRWDDDE